MIREKLVPVIAKTTDAETEEHVISTCSFLFRRSPRGLVASLHTRTYDLMTMDLTLPSPAWGQEQP